MKLLNPKYLIATLAIFCFFSTQKVKAQVNTQDSLALVDFYDSAGGPNWTTNTNWLTKAPVSTWFGVTVDSLSGRVVGLNLTIVPSIPIFNVHSIGVKLKGTIPESIGNLTELRELILSNINVNGFDPFKPVPDSSFGLIGTIPRSIANLTKLAQLDLSFNHLIGEIPKVICSFNNLTNLSFADNNFTGTIPDSIGKLINLDTLFLNYNQLTSRIPLGIGNLTNLKDLDLSNNKLSGTIPDTLTNLRNALTGHNFNLSNNLFTFAGLENFFSWADTVQYSGFILEEIYNFYIGPQNTLLSINKTGATLSVSAGGTLANDTFKWYRDSVLVDTKVGDSTYTVTTPGLYHVIVTNSIVSYPTYFTNYQGLVLNSDTVSVFSPVTTNDSLALVDFYNSTNGANWKDNTNWLTTAPLSTWNGIVLDSSGRVSQINLYTNNLTGKLPNSIGNLTHLTYISLHINAIGGDIPASIGNLTNLTSLDLGENGFTGTIPDSLASLTNLVELDLSGNKLIGVIPSWIGNFKNLKDIWLHYNNLSDSIPSSIGNLTKLEYVVLQNNQLSGPIPASFGNLNNIKGLFLQNNNFTFDGMELIATKFPFAVYAPQAPIKIYYYGYSGDSIKTSVGGTPSNNTFIWWNQKYDSIFHTPYQAKVGIGDSTYTPYYSSFSVTSTWLVATNSIASQLTLYSDTLVFMPVPIKSISLQAKESNGKVLLQWNTINELNTASFTIQRSSNGVNFTDVNSKSALGKGNNNYSMIDELPSDGINYYRIKVIDKDGKISYSKVATLQLTDHTNQLTVFPNPCKDKITIKGNHIVSIQVVDNAGRVLKTYTSNDATNPTLSVSTLPTGIYHLRVQTTDGKVSGVGFVKE